MRFTLREEELFKELFGQILKVAAKSFKKTNNVGFRAGALV